MNSSAALKAFVGRNGGAVCTSSNARAVITWALEKGPDQKLLFFPDQHLGSTIAVGTEIHLVQRLAHEHPDRTVVSLDPLICPCSTMFRIDAAHLAWVLEGLVSGEVPNRITVDADTKVWARVALQRMLDIT